MIKNISLILILMALFTSCSKSYSSRSDQPSWLISLDGYRNNGLVATGCANIHVRGFDAQKKLAIQRAADKIAMQKHTKVSSISTKSEVRYNGSLSKSKYKNQSTYSSNANVSFQIKEDYFDKINQKYCVLIKE